MSGRQLIVAYCCEGTTDEAFLHDVISKSVDYCLSNYSNMNVELLDVIPLKGGTGSFVEKHLAACRRAVEKGAELVVVHTDADGPDDKRAMETKIDPLQDAVQKESSDACCSVVVPVVPVHEIEAWLMADKELLKRQMGTERSDADLGLDRQPESYANPKQTIAEAIAKVKADTTKRRRNSLVIGDLYEPVGRQLSIETLLGLPSFARFLNAFRSALADLHICHGDQ